MLNSDTCGPAHSGTITDLTWESCETVVGICRELLGAGAYVLHGSNVRQPLRIIEPRQANDAAKGSGNLFAVYASANVEAVLMHAVLDRAYLSSRLESYTVGYQIISGRLFFRATDNLYELFQRKDARLFSNGYVYALDKSRFAQATESACEFFAPQPVAPQLTLKVPASLGSWLFRIDAPESADTVVRYTAGEKLRLAAHEAKLNAATTRQ